MKKSKLFISLTGVSVLGAATPIIATSTSCGCNPSVTLSEIKAEDTAAKRICGESIKKSEIKVTATYSNNSTKEITDWTCDDFNNEGVYTPSDIKTFNHTFTIKYSENNIEKTTSIKINFSADGVTGFALDEYDLAMPIKDVTPYSTVQKLVVFWKDGEMVDPSLLDFSVDNEECASIDAEGVLTTLKTTTYRGAVTVTAKWKDQSHGTEDITAKVAIGSFSLGEKPIVDLNAKDNTATIKIDDEWCQFNKSMIVPRSIIADGSTYKVVGISDQSTSVTRAKILSIPQTVTSICDNALDNCDIFKIYYNGTKADFGKITQGDLWYGDKAIGVQCTDDFVLFQNRYDAQIYSQSAYTTGSYLDAGSALGKDEDVNFLVRFDYSKLGLTTAEQARKVSIVAWTWTTNIESYQITINNLYIDGEKAKENTDYKYENKKLIWQSTSSLAADSVVTIDFSLTETSTTDVYIAAAQLK